MENSISIENQPPPGSSDGSQHGGPGTIENGELKQVSNDVARSIKARKRTKTGCLSMHSRLLRTIHPGLTQPPACRKRRIKCGEERPTCANCVKSRRSCEGYAPRLTFRDPLSAIVPGWAVREHYNGIPTGNGVAGQVARSANGSQLPAIAPRPMPISQLPLPQAPPSQTKPSSKPLINGFQPTANSFNTPAPIPEPIVSRFHEPYHRPDGLPRQANQSSNGTAGADFAPSAPQAQVPHYPVEDSNAHQLTYDSQWLQNSVPPGPIQTDDLNQLQFFHPPVDRVPEQPILSGTQYSIPSATVSDPLYSLAPVNHPNQPLAAPGISSVQPGVVFDYQGIQYSQPQHDQWAEPRVEEPFVHAQGMCH